MGGLLSLNISNNHFVGEKGNGRFTEKTYDSDGNTDDESEEIMEPDFSGVIALADGIKNLTSLDISDNKIGAYFDGDFKKWCSLHLQSGQWVLEYG
jgi:hypothetical protein